MDGYASNLYIIGTDSQVYILAELEGKLSGNIIGRAEPGECRVWTDIPTTNICLVAINKMNTDFQAGEEGHNQKCLKEGGLQVNPPPPQKKLVFFPLIHVGKFSTIFCVLSKRQKCLYTYTFS